MKDYIIAKVPENTAPYNCGERLMACIVDVDGNKIEYVKGVAWFKNRDEAIIYCEENPKYHFNRK